jgi:hypothetical protein
MINGRQTPTHRPILHCKMGAQEVAKIAEETSKFPIKGPKFEVKSLL